MTKVKINWMSNKSVRDDQPLKTVKERNAFLRGYGAIVHSSQLRRLSHKTQVHLNPNFDYVRTRLTHSLEVSQIGRQLARMFTTHLNINEYENNSISGDFKRDFEELTATACLAHDIGQAPFGHAGEKKLNEIMKKYEMEFDANKQNVRLLLGSDARSPFDVPYCLVDAVMKYKNKDVFKKKNGALYVHEKDKIDKILKETGLSNVRHPSCYLMEAADDIAYICGDIEDAIKHRLIPQNSLIDLLRSFPVLGEEYTIETNLNWKNIVEENWTKPNVITNHLIKVLISHCDDILKAADIFSGEIEGLPQRLHDKIEEICHPDETHNLLYCDVNGSNTGKDIQKLKSSIYFDYILKSERVIEAEYFSEKMIGNLFDEFMNLKGLDKKMIGKNKLFGILPDHVKSKVETYLDQHETIKEEDLARLVCDYISGMTDRYAIFFWEKTNSPQSLKIAS